MYGGEVMVAAGTTGLGRRREVDGGAYAPADRGPEGCHHRPGETPAADLAPEGRTQGSTYRPGQALRDNGWGVVKGASGGVLGPIVEGVVRVVVGPADRGPPPVAGQPLGYPLVAGGFRGVVLVVVLW